jgi:hypothetical protein
MLLYDRLLRWATTHRYTQEDTLLWTRLCQAQVFELSELVPLMPDWEQGRQAPISKRPPYPTLWGEWFYDDVAPAGHPQAGSLSVGTWARYCGNSTLTPYCICV